MSALLSALGGNLADALDKYEGSRNRRAQDDRDAAAKAQDLDNEQRSYELAVVEPIIAGIQSIHQIDRTPHGAAALMRSVKADYIARAGWIHTQEAEHVMQSLDDLADYLEGA